MKKAVFLLLCGVPGVIFAGHAVAPKGTATPLTSIGAVSDPDAKADPDDPGVGGSFDSTTYFRNRLTSPAAIAACASNIERVATAWASKFKFSRALRDLEPAGLKLQYVKVGVKGLFEFTYKVELQTRARVSVNFYAQDGTMLDPSNIQSFLTEYDIGSLEDSLDAALRCGRQGA